MHAASSKTYNKIARGYDEEDFGKVYANTRAVSCAQITQTMALKKPKILDFSAGTGNALKTLKSHYPEAQFIGNDLSKNMLSESKKKMHGANYTTILGDVNQIHQHIDPASQDLILCHYLFSYVDRAHIMRQAYQLLKPGGYLSIASTTKEQFSEFYQKLKQGEMGKTAKWFTHSLTLERYLEPVGTPKSAEHLMEEAQSINFNIADTKTYREKMYFLSYQDMKSWAYDSGWAANYFEKYPHLKLSVLRSMYSVGTLIHKPNRTLSARNDIVLILLQKPKHDTESKA
jgi:ubiquinone/menaquinone biosynthesis C-methylase UbiE